MSVIQQKLQHWWWSLLTPNGRGHSWIYVRARRGHFQSYEIRQNMYQWIKEGENRKNLMLSTLNCVRAGCTSDLFIMSGIAPRKAVTASDHTRGFQCPFSIGSYPRFKYIIIYYAFWHIILYFIHIMCTNGRVCMWNVCEKEYYDVCTHECVCICGMYVSESICCMYQWACVFVYVYVECVWVRVILCMLEWVCVYV